MVVTTACSCQGFGRRSALVLLALGIVLGSSLAAPVPLSNNIMMFYDSEYEPHYGQPISQCELQLQRAKQQGSKIVSLVPTHYWLDYIAKGTAGQCNADNWMRKGEVFELCSKYEWDSKCIPLCCDTLDRFARGFQKCMQKAYDMGFDVMVTPHLDDGSKYDYWRNFLRYDPAKRDKNGRTWWEILLGPITRAAKAVFKDPSRTIWITLQGEMGATLQFFPDQWLALAKQVRQEYGSGGSKLLVGLAWGHNFLPGVVNRANGTRGSLPVTPLSKVGGGAILPFDKWPERDEIAKNLPSFKKLLDTVDYYGISNYPRSKVNVAAADMEYGIWEVDSELAQMGISLSKLLKSGKKLVWTEFGLGGGNSRCSNVPATNPADAAYSPDLGISTTYTKKSDPWQRPALQQFRRQFHAAALQVLSQGGLKYPVSAAFLWNIVSWDVQGIHPASSSAEGSYSDPVITAAIKAHNAQGYKA